VVDEANLSIPVFVTTAVVDQEPISINDAFTVYRGTMHLKAAGKAFRDAVKSAVMKSSMDWKTAHECVYQHGGRAELHVTLYFTNLLNKTWTKTNKIKTRYKKKDASNYIKLIEDGVARGSGIDDCNNLDVTISKRHDPEHPRVEVTLATYAADRESFITLVDGDG